VLPKKFKAARCSFSRKQQRIESKKGSSFNARCSRAAKAGERRNEETDEE